MCLLRLAYPLSCLPARKTLKGAFKVSRHNAPSTVARWLAEGRTRAWLGVCVCCQTWLYTGGGLPCLCDSGWLRIRSGSCRLAYGLYLQAVWPWRRVVQSPAVKLDRRTGSIRVGPHYLVLLHDTTLVTRSPDQVLFPAVYLLARLAAFAVCGFPPWSIYSGYGYRMVQPSRYLSCWSMFAVRPHGSSVTT